MKCKKQFPMSRSRYHLWGQVSSSDHTIIVILSCRSESSYICLVVGLDDFQWFSNILLETSGQNPDFFFCKICRILFYDLVVACGLSVFEKNLFYFTSGSIFLLMDLFLLKVCSCRRVGEGNNGSVVSLENKKKSSL